MFTLNQNTLDVVEYCAQECRRQRSGEMSVFWMLNAWDFASFHFARCVNWREMSDLITEDVIDRLGMAVEPKQNLFGFRRSNVIVNGNLIGHKNIADNIHRLCSMATDMTADEFYVEFENIHPFIDGNGRVGSLLWNMMSETIFRPVAPPDFFGMGEDYA